MCLIQKHWPFQIIVHCKEKVLNDFENVNTNDTFDVSKDTNKSANDKKNLHFFFYSKFFFRNCHDFNNLIKDRIDFFGIFSLAKQLSRLVSFDLKKREVQRYTLCNTKKGHYRKDDLPLKLGLKIA